MTEQEQRAEKLKETQIMRNIWELDGMRKTDLALYSFPSRTITHRPNIQSNDTSFLEKKGFTHTLWSTYSEHHTFDL